MIFFCHHCYKITEFVYMRVQNRYDAMFLCDNHRAKGGLTSGVESYTRPTAHLEWNYSAVFSSMAANVQINAHVMKVLFNKICTTRPIRCANGEMNKDHREPRAIERRSQVCYTIRCYMHVIDYLLVICHHIRCHSFL